MALGNGAKSLQELRDITGSTSQSLLPTIRKLEGPQIITRTADVYELTPVGRIMNHKVNDLVSTTVAIRRHHEFYRTHDLEGIPAPFLERISDFINSDLLRATDDDVLRVNQYFAEAINEGSRIDIVSSIVAPWFCEPLAQRAREVPVDLIITEHIAAMLKEEPYLSHLEQLHRMTMLRIWICPFRFRMALIVTDAASSLGLYKKETERFDITEGLRSESRTAIAWGRDLHECLRSRSTLFFPEK